MTTVLEALAKNAFAARFIAQILYLALPLFPNIRDLLSEEIARFVKPDQNRSRRTLRKLRKDMLYSRLRYEINFSQYFIHGFEKLTHKGRREYVGEREKERYVRAVNRAGGSHDTFRQKHLAYQTFKPFYHREVLQISPEEREEFLKFTKRNPKFILKYADEALGKGVRIIDQAASGESMEAFFDGLIQDQQHYIVEELIVQAPEMMALHPSSVNTVRFSTYLKDDTVLHLFSFLRMGSGGGVIDNATAGGLAAAIDPETGIVTSEACREDLTRMLFHPDTGVQIIGMQIPRWQELLSLVDQLARVVPQQPFVGWDLALTDGGWVMVEGNDNAMITAIQMCERRGLRDRFDRAFRNDAARKERDL
ncbi:MAG: hypothetical protein IKH03_03815 [Oscillospiraceae bacterium]|nr:hypothetical protein [Oscillospiraceae bacterium]